MINCFGYALKRFARPILLALGLLSSNFAFGAIYNVLFKPANSTTPLTCAVGGFTFDKTVVGSFPPLTPETATLTASCLGMPDGTYTGSVNVIVENVSLNGRDLGPNVVGLSGTICTPNCTSPTASIQFNYVANSASTVTPGRTLTLTGGSSSSGDYYLYNAACNNGDSTVCLAVPEPNALLLVFAALAASFVAMRARRRRV